MPSIDLHELDFAFPATRLFSGLSLSISGPSLVALLGASGSGKSTLLRLIAGVLKPQKGSIRMSPHNPGSVAWVPQDATLFPWLSVEGNIAFPMTLSWNSKTEVKDVNSARRICEIADGLSISSILKRFPIAISGGQKRRASIGRALAAGSKILLMDEPFSALDPQTRADVRRLIRRTCRENEMIVILATHDLLDAAFISDRVIVLSPTHPAQLTDLPIDSNVTVGERPSNAAAAIAAKLGTVF